MKITDRDQELLRVAYEQQLISIGQAARYFFRGDRSNAASRLRDLTEAGFLREADGLQALPHKMYRPSGAGIARAKTLTQLRVPQRRKFALSTIEHDLLVTDVRLRLSQFWDASWLPERVLRADEYRQIPDGVLLFSSGRKIAIEVENSVKAKRRYQRIWQKWPGTGTFLVLYVATSPAIAGVLRKLLIEAPRDAAFGLVEWNALNADQPLIWTPRGEVDLLAKRTL